MPITTPASRFATDGEAAMPKGRILVLLYERLLRDLDDADAAIAAANPAATHQALMHAQEIVAALEAALDTDVWPEGRSLASVYSWLLDELLAANLGKDRARVASCRAVVEPLAATWAEAFDASQRQSAQRIGAVASPGLVAVDGSVAERPRLDLAG